MIAAGRGAFTGGMRFDSYEEILVETVSRYGYGYCQSTFSSPVCKG